MIYISQFIFVKSGQEEKFYQFENEVLPLLIEYGGRVVYRIRPKECDFINSDGRKPHEIHLVSFKDLDGLNRYKNDKRRLQFAHLKNESVDMTITTQSV